MITIAGGLLAGNVVVHVAATPPILHTTAPVPYRTLPCGNTSFIFPPTGIGECTVKSN